MVLAEISAIFVIAFILHWLWKRRHLYILSWKLPGDVGYPILGNGLLFLGPTKDLLKKIKQTASRFKKPLRLWIGPQLFIYFSSAQHSERILLSYKISQKHEVYKFLQPLVGDGLITASGPKWRKQRKLIQPLFSATFVSEHSATIEAHLNKCSMKLLKTHVNGKSFDINEYVHRCVCDFITEILMGESFNVQFSKKREDFFQALIEGYDIFFARLVKPWLQPDSLYRLTKSWGNLKRVQKVATETTREMIDKSRKRIHAGNKTRSIVDQLVCMAENDPLAFSDDDLVHQLLTLYLASEDTIAAITSFACMCFGMYPEYQEKAYEEIISVTANKQDGLSISDLGQLQYLDMCLKETLRVAPIAPFIVREPFENFEIDGLIIPPGCGVFLSILDLHYDPTHWENPSHFHPDHFLPEAVAKRHPYAYVPFSGGPRGCIGKIFANAAIKLALVSILRNFAIEADGKLPDVELRTDISIRPLNGYMVRLKKRE